jgi:predicted XRE-type DNA-binding protein
MKTKQTVNNSKFQFERSFGNIYKDLGYKKPDEMLIKAELAVKIAKVIKLLGLTQLEAAEKIGISQDKVSNLLRGNFSRLSEKKMMNCLINLGYDIRISIKPSRTSVGHLMVA